MKNMLVSGAALLAFSTATVNAAVVFYTDEAAWLGAVEDVETLQTTSANVGLADELSSAPSQNDFLGSVLTFSQTNTGFSQGFKVETLETGAEFTFSDGEASPATAGFEDALSVGDLNDYEDDDWRLTLLSGGRDVYAFGLILRDNGDVAATESFSVYDPNGGLIGSTTSVPNDDADSYEFFGFIASQPFGSVEFDEGDDRDDIAIADFQFAVPEPGSLALLALGGIGLLRRRRMSQHIG
jgi:hypothetical protein